MKIGLETKFTKNTIWRKAIETSSKSAYTTSMQELMSMVRLKIIVIFEVRFVYRAACFKCAAAMHRHVELLALTSVL